MAGGGKKCCGEEEQHPHRRHPASSSRLLPSSCRSPLLGCLPCCGGAWRKEAGDGGEERSRRWRGGIDPAEVQQVAEATRSLSPRQLRRRGSLELQVENDGGHRRAERRPCRLRSASCRSICDARSQKEKGGRKIRRGKRGINASGLPPGSSPLVHDQAAPPLTNSLWRMKLEIEMRAGEDKMCSLVLVFSTACTCSSTLLIDEHTALGEQTSPLCPRHPSSDHWGAAVHQVACEFDAGDLEQGRNGRKTTHGAC